METSRFVDGLRADLAAAAALGDQAIVEAADRLARAVESSVRMHLLDALQEAAMELTAQLPNGRIDVRLSGGVGDYGVRVYTRNRSEAVRRYGELYQLNADPLGDEFQQARKALEGHELELRASHAR